MQSSILLQATLDTIILWLLKNEGPLHGYAIQEKIKLLSKDKIKISLSSIYILLHKLKKEKMLVTSSGLSKNRLRVYYALTPAGQKLLKQKTSELNDFVRSLRVILDN